MPTYFLAEADYIAFIRDSTLDDLIEYDSEVRTDAELAAQAEMEAYLRDRFNVAAIFGATGTDRNRSIVMYMVDIALYHMYSAVTPKFIPDIRVDRYTRAMKWLDMVRIGDINPGLPAAENPTTGEGYGTSIFGSNQQNGYRW